MFKLVALALLALILQGCANQVVTAPRPSFPSVPAELRQPPKAAYLLQTTTNSPQTPQTTR